MKEIGYLLGVVGALLMAYGIGSSGAAEYSDTLNIGLLNDKSNLVMAGGFLAVCGTILIAAASIVVAFKGGEALSRDARAEGDELLSTGAC